MLRLTVLVLVLANCGYYAWANELLAPWGLGPVPQAETQRLAQQIRPEALRIVGAAEARRLENAAPASMQAPECLSAGPFDEPATQLLRQALLAWPADTWTLDAVAEPPRWIVYMGKFQTPEAAARKKAELRQLGVTFEPLSNPALEVGLSLGGFASQGAANQSLQRLVERGVQTARVLQERGEVRGTILKLPAVDDALRPRLDDLLPALAGKALRPCR